MVGSRVTCFQRGFLVPFNIVPKYGPYISLWSENLPKGMNAYLCSDLPALTIKKFQPINVRLSFWLIKGLRRWIFKIARIRRLRIALFAESDWKIEIDINSTTKMIIIGSIFAPHSVNIVAVLITIWI